MEFEEFIPDETFRSEFDAFSNVIEKRIQVAPESSNEYSMPAMLGTALTTPKENRVDVLLRSGEILRNVPIKGGYITQEGYLHGVIGGVQEKQTVLVSFSHGSSYAPVITASFTIPGDERDLSNFDKWLKTQSGFVENDDFAVGHKSGYLSLFRNNKIELKSKSNQNIFKLDIAEKELTVTEGEIKAPHTTELKLWMEEIVNVLNNLYMALQNSTTTPADGGASYKGQIVLALQSMPVPNVPNKLESTNVKYSEKPNV